MTTSTFKRGPELRDWEIEKKRLPLFLERSSGFLNEYQLERCCRINLSSWPVDTSPDSKWQAEFKVILDVLYIKKVWYKGNQDCPWNRLWIASNASFLPCLGILQSYFLTFVCESCDFPWNSLKPLLKSL